jgi:hypothetical protein
MFVSSQTDSIFVTLTGFIDNAISFNFQSKNCGAEWRYLLKIYVPYADAEEGAAEWGKR